MVHQQSRSPPQGAGRGGGWGHQANQERKFLNFDDEYGTFDRFTYAKVGRSSLVSLRLTRHSQQ